MNKNRKLLIIGLDGATFQVIDPLIKAGRMPTLKRLVESGTSAVMTSTLPPISSTAWISFMTGKDPGNHGNFDFRNLDLSKYGNHDENFVNSGVIQGSTIFDHLGSKGKKVVAYQVPITYPPWKINGKMVSGYPTPNHKVAYTYPEELSKEIGKLYTHSPDEITAANTEKKVQIYSKNIERNTSVLIKLLRQRDYDLFMYVNGVSDGVQHRFWKFYDSDYPVNDETNKKYKDLIPYFYAKIDDQINDLLKEIDDDTTVIIMSDHGGGPRPSIFFNINCWLAGDGLLAINGSRQSELAKYMKYAVEWSKENLPFKEWVKRNLNTRLKENISKVRTLSGAIDWENTQAYRVKLSHPVEGININLKGRQPKGAVPISEYEGLRSRIIEKIIDVTDEATKEKLVKEAYRKEEIYKGNCMDNIPDIILVLNAKYDGGYNLDKLISPVPTSFLSEFSGYHTMDGIFIINGKDVKAQKRMERINLIDLAPTITYYMGLPVPENMDGRIIQGVFKKSFLNSNPVHYEKRDIDLSSNKSTTLSKEENEDIKKALEGLGYV